MTITPSTHAAVKNGMRARILKLLDKEGLLTTDEIAQQLGQTVKQIRDNSNQARKEGLIESRIDDVTQRLGYKITPAGREWVKGLTALNQMPAATHKENLTVADEEFTDEAPSISDAPAIEASEQEAMFSNSISGTSEESSAVADDLAPNEAPAIADAPEEDRDLYVVFGASMPVPEIAGPTLENAQQQCISLAFDSGCDLTLYRLVPVGQTRTSVTFVSQ